MLRLSSSKPAILSLLLCGALLSAAPVHADCEDTHLGEVMESMKKAFKGMREAAKAGDWSVLASTRVELQDLAASAVDEQPLKLKDLAADDQAPFLDDYRRGVDELRLKLDKLAAAEAQQDLDAARALVEDIGKHSKDSHKSFKKDCG